MWRLFYKSILISIISSMLMLGDMVAYADTQGTPTKGSDGKVSVTNTYDMKEAKSDGAVSILTMIAVGYIGTRLYTYQKYTTDMLVAAAAGGIYIVGEIMNILNYKKEMAALNVSATFKNDGSIDSAQVEYIKKLRESYEEAKKALETKKMLQTTAMVGFAAAAGVAAWQRFTEEGQYASCEAAVVAGKNTLAACISAGAAAAATGYAAKEGAFCTRCLPQMVSFAGTLKIQKVTAEIPGPSMSKEAVDEAYKAQTEVEKKTPCGGETATAVQASITGACDTYAATKKINNAFGVFAAVTNTEQPNQNLLNKILFPTYVVAKKQTPTVTLGESVKEKFKSIFSLAFPSAHAGWGSIFGGAAGALLTLYGPLSKWVDTQLFTPGGRILIWTGFATLCGFGISATKDKIADVEDNIKKIDAILNETSKLNKGIKISNSIVKTVQINTDLSGAYNDVTLSTTDKTGCLATTSKSTTTSSTSTCASLNAAFQATTTSIGSMPTALQDAASSVTKVADGISGTGTISGTTLTQASAVSNKATAISKLLKQQQNSLNDLLKKNGKAEINFDKDAELAKSNLTNLASQSLSKQGTSANAVLASMGISAPTGSSHTAAEKIESASGGKKSKVATPIANVNAVPAKENLDFKDLNEKQDPNANAVLANGMREGSANDRYDIKENDINKDKGISIFEVISSRYKNSAYPKLLEEVK